MQNFLYDKINIIPEAKRRGSRRRSRGFLGGILSKIGAIIIVLMAIIMLPFILIRERRNPSNNVLINDDVNNIQNNSHKVDQKK